MTLNTRGLQNILNNIPIFSRLNVTGKFTLLSCAAVFFWLIIMFILSQNLQQQKMQDLLTVSSQAVSDMAMQQLHKIKEGEQHNATEHAALYASLAARDIVSDDTESLQHYATIAAKDPDITYIAIRDRTGNILSTAGTLDPDQDFTVEEDIRGTDGDSIGTVILGNKRQHSARSMNAASSLSHKSQTLMQNAMSTGIAETRQQLLLLISLAMLISIGTAYLFGRGFSRELVAISKVMQDFSEGKADITTRCRIRSNDEIGDIARAFNIMGAKIHEASVRDEEQIQELKQAADINDKIDVLLGVVSSAAEGDLTGKVNFSGNQPIDQLAGSIGLMVENLRHLVKEVQKSGIQVTSSATEIASAAKQQEATTTEQAASTHEIMATVTEISATSKELANTMEGVSSVAETTARSAEIGQDALTQMEGAMIQMREATSSITTKLAVLSDKASNINTVVTTINKVADQTNLLSLNAAIEAEKAGEYGKGFSVVATEIRRLADQTAVATWDIEQMVKEMQSSVSAGVMGMDKFSEEVSRGAEEVGQVSDQLGLIIDQVQTLTPQFDSVSQGMQSQSQGAEQISESMIQLNETAQQTAESLKQSNTSIEQLNEAAHWLQECVSRFKVD
jgi:methyl-accepting chemotaxis protein WspA